MSSSLGPDFERALHYAVGAHGGQTRKETDIPYASHLLAVSALILEAGGTEDQAIAGLLHDVPEDCGGQVRLDEIRDRFGRTVGDIVEACSDSLVEDSQQKASWRERKIAYIEHLADVGPEALLVSLADKVHNATSILRDFGTEGVEMFTRFTIGKTGGAAAGRAATEWYYGKLVEAFDARCTELSKGGLVLLRELRTTVVAIQACSAEAHEA